MYRLDFFSCVFFFFLIEEDSDSKGILQMAKHWKNCILEFFLRLIKSKKQVDLTF